MSLKPLKKSDLDKGWMKRRSGKPVKIRPEYHLIVTEGTNTEPAYFQAMKDVINQQYPNRIHLDIAGTGKNTLALFEEAYNLTRNNPNGYSHVWIVYDTDDFPKRYIDQTVELCREATNSETTYHAIWSNQCIELWFLLHFAFFHSDIHRNEYWPKLNTFLTSLERGNYAKNRGDMYEILYPYMDIAIRNARNLNDINHGRCPSEAAPGTKVYELIEKLRPYL